MDKLNFKEYLRALRGLQKYFVEQWNGLKRQQVWNRYGVEISPQAIIRTTHDSVLKIGSGSIIGPYSILDLLDDPLDEGHNHSEIIIGKRVAINEFNNIRAGGGEIYIGDGSLISQHVTIVGTNHSISISFPIRDQPWDMTKRTVTIGEDVWVGAQSVILPGVCIGHGAVIAAGAVVSGTIPEYAIAAGIPARVIRYRQ